MQQNEIKINNKTFQIPQTWNDLTIKQLLFCYGVVMTDLSDDFLTGEEMQGKRSLLTTYLLSLNEKFHKDLQADMTEYGTDADVMYLSALQDLQVVADFAFECVNPDALDEPKLYQIALTRTALPWKSLEAERKLRKKVGFRKGRKPATKKVFAPADGLSNISIYELGVTFTLFENYMQSRDEDTLHELLAVLYRPAKIKTKKEKLTAYGGDRRISHLGSEATTDRRAKQMAGLPVPVKQAILFWFASCRQKIIADYPNVFVSPEDADTRKKSGNQYGWGGVILEMSSRDISKLPDVAQQKAADALTFLSYIEDQRKLEDLQRLEASV